MCGIAGFVGKRDQGLLEAMTRALIHLYEDQGEMNYFNPFYIRWMMDEHFRGHRNFTDKLWSLLAFQVWHKIFMERSAAIG